jgi:hypothetical protein
MPTRGIRHVPTYVRKILEESESAARKSGGFALHEKIGSTQKRHDQLAERTAQTGDGLAERTEEEMAGLVRHLIDVV